MIDPYDRKAVEAVWRRVRQAQKPVPSAEDFLWEALSMELERSRSYRALAIRAPGFRRQLEQLAVRGERNCQRLRAVFRKPSPRALPAVAREQLPLGQMLQQLAQDAASAASIYSDRAEQDPKLRRLLQSLAQENRRQSGILLSMSRGKP